MAPSNCQYNTKAPETIQLSVGQLLTYVPPEWVEKELADLHAIVRVPCAEVLRTHVPRISVAYLKNLIPPQILKIPPEVKPDAQILLEAAHLALAFKVDGSPTPPDRSSLQEPAPLKEIRQEANSSAAPASSRKVLEAPQTLDANTLSQLQGTYPEPILPKTLLGKIIRLIRKKFSKNIIALEKPDLKSAASHFALTPRSIPDRKTIFVQPDENAPILAHISKSTLFSSLPKLVEKGSAPTLQPSSPPAPSFLTEKESPGAQSLSPKSQSFPPKQPIDIASPSISDCISPEVTPLETVSDFPTDFMEDPQIEEPAKQPTILDQKNLITPLSHPSEPLANEYELQKLFMTQERFSISRALDYCCMKFPEVRGCILTRDWQVVASSQPIQNLDVAQLGIESPELMKNVAKFSEKMNLQIQGASLFTSLGPITIFQEGDLCLLAIHEGHKYSLTPGVPENLQTVLAILHRSTLSIPPASKAETIE